MFLLLLHLGAIIQTETPEIADPEIAEILAACEIADNRCPQATTISIAGSSGRTQRICRNIAQTINGRVTRRRVCTVVHSSCRATRSTLAPHLQSLVEEIARERSYQVRYTANVPARLAYILDVRPDHFYTVRFDLSGVPNSRRSRAAGCFISAQAVRFTRVEGSLVGSSDDFTNEVISSVRDAIR